jgi:hypothetical protein
VRFLYPVSVFDWDELEIGMNRSNHGLRTGPTKSVLSWALQVAAEKSCMYSLFFFFPPSIHPSAGTLFIHLAASPSVSLPFIPVNRESPAPTAVPPTAEPESPWTLLALLPPELRRKFVGNFFVYFQETLPLFDPVTFALLFDAGAVDPAVLMSVFTVGSHFADESDLAPLGLGPRHLLAARLANASWKLIFDRNLVHPGLEIATAALILCISEYLNGRNLRADVLLSAFFFFF